MLNNLNHSQHWLLITNSTPLSKSKLLPLAKHKKIMALDGAYEHMARLNLHIDILLGDFDSIHPETLALAHKKNTQIVHTPNQNRTDLEKGIAYLDQLEAKTITLCAATGKRLQHTLYNLRLLKKFYRTNRLMTLLTHNETIHYIENNSIDIYGSLGDSVGILGFPEAAITTNGLKYEVENYSLQFELTASISNELTQPQATIHVEGAALVIHERLGC